MEQPIGGNTVQHDMMSEMARFILLSIMHSHIIREVEHYSTAQEIWNRLKIIYGCTSAARLRAMTFKFETYLMDCKHTTAELLESLVMIHDLKSAGNSFSNVQRVLATIRSLDDFENP